MRTGSGPRAFLIVSVVLAGALVALVALLATRGRERAVPSAVTSRAAATTPADAHVTVEPLEIAVEDDAAPWSQRDGTGYANDLVRAAFAAAGVEVHLQVVPYARCKQMAIEGQVVACFSMSRQPELAEQIELSDQPLFVCYADLVERAAAARHLAGEDDLARGTVVGVVIGYEYPEALYRLERAGKVVLEPSVSEELNLKKLADGRIDAAVANNNETKTLDGMIARAGATGRVRLAFRVGVLPSYLGFSRKHPRAGVARARFNHGFRTILTDGTHERIAQAWAARAHAQADAPRR